MASVLPDKWQVVRNSSGGKPAKKATKDQQQEKAALFKPVPLAPNTYEDLEDENNPESSDDDITRYQLLSNGKAVKKPQAPAAAAKKGKGKAAPPPPPGPPDIISLDFAKLAGSIAICRSKFPDNDLLLLQEVANFLRMDADFSGAIKLSPSMDEFSFPLKHLNPKQLAELRTIVGSVQEEEAYCRFIEYVIEEITTAMSRNEPLLSHRLCLQLVSLERPESFLKLTEKYASIIKSSKHAANKLSAIMAAFSQAGHGSLSVGLNVWFTVMLPTIQLPNMIQVTLAYGEKLLQAYNVLNDLQLPPSSAPQALRPAFDLLMNSLQNCQPYNPPPNFELFAHEVALTPQNFFRLYDMVYPVNAATGKMTQPAYLTRMTPAQKRQLATLCFKIKVLLMKFGCDCCPSTMFPSFLVRYNENLPVFVKKEMLSNLLVCLHCDQAGCSQAWIGTCNRYPQNAGFLSASVTENMSFFADFIPDVSQLRKTLRNVDSAVAAAGSKGAEGRWSIRGVCAKFFSRVFYVVRTVSLLVVLALLADFLLADCNIQATQHVKLLRRYNLYKPLTQAWAGMQKQTQATVAYLYPTCAALFDRVAPYSVRMGESIFAVYEPTAKFLSKHWQQVHAGAGDYATRANVWLVANGVDLKVFANWITQTAVPTVVKSVLDGWAVVWSYLDKSVVPYVKHYLGPIASTFSSSSAQQGL